MQVIAQYVFELAAEDIKESHVEEQSLLTLNYTLVTIVKPFVGNGTIQLN